MTSYELEMALVAMFKKLISGGEAQQVGKALIDSLEGQLLNVTSYEQDMTDERGCLLTMRDGSELQLTIRRAR